nr:hypothetical protein GCM10020092_006930 [Actinoplanes digitatis]
MYAAKCPVTRTAVTRQITATGPRRMILIDALSCAPARTARSRGSAGSLGSTATTATAQIAPAPASTANATRQPSHWPSAVPSGTPSTIASELPRNTSAVARPALPGGTSRAATGAIVDQKTPCAIAQIRRDRVRIVNVAAKTAMSWEIAKIATVAAMSRCRGTRMVSAVSGMVDSAATTA